MEYGDNTFGYSTPVELDAIEAENNSTEEEIESTPEETTTAPETDNAETQEETEETQVEEQPLILGKFKTVADLEKAYRNLEAYNTKLSQQAKAAPKVEQQPKPVEDEAAKDQQMVDWYEREVQNNPINANATLARYMAEKEINKRMAEINSKLENDLSPIVRDRQNAEALKLFKAKYPDANQYADVMDAEASAMVEDYPDILNNPSMFYETLYFRAKTKALEEKSKTAFENGKKTAQEELKKKKSVHNETKNNNTEEDELPPGITIRRGDGFFL